MVSVDYTIHEMREFWRSVFLAVLARHELTPKEPGRAVIQATLAADDACERLTLRVFGET
jgi:hypothetical protein